MHRAQSVASRKTRQLRGHSLVLAGGLEVVDKVRRASLPTELLAGRRVSR
jgi:hypothetical protein